MFLGYVGDGNGREEDNVELRDARGVEIDEPNFTRSAEFISSSVVKLVPWEDSRISARLRLICQR